MYKCISIADLYVEYLSRDKKKKNNDDPVTCNNYESTES